MLRKEIIQVWKKLKGKVLTYQPVKEIQTLLTKLETVQETIHQKENQIQKVLGGNRYLGDLSWEDREKVENLQAKKKKIVQEQVIPLKEKLASLNPLWGKEEITRLENLLVELKESSILLSQKEKLADVERLNYLNLGFDEQYNNLQIKHDNLQGKLEKVRDLVANEQIDKLKRLITRGEL